ncbi:MrcB family domain-containing protein [Saccharopolyspora taberi]|uniref:Type IV methyl-directed restriction enzyme EcoKMcrB subunit DNA-binding domain-containing protein n=1 Tax=Saccharopolyspora taberi TaxID=60895 RepID=A0ABN3V3F6_9PSEU
MNLRDLLGRVTRTYVREEGQQSHAARLLRGAGTVVDGYVPVGYLVKGSSGQSTPAFVPWIAVFDPDHTTSAMHGIYVVYLFAADMRTIFLALLCGSEETRKEFRGRALDILADRAEAIRDALGAEVREGLEDRIRLGAPSRVQRPKYYEAGTIVAKRYDAEDLPTDTELADDLLRHLHLYELAVDRYRQLALVRPDVVVGAESDIQPEVMGEFKPKDDADYEQIIKARKIKKSRKHETLLKKFNDHLRACGFATGSPHPRDLVAERDGQSWLVEAKVLQRGNGVQATRDALSQLIWYRYCHYSEPRAVRMLALFNEPVGDLCLEILQEVNIEGVWPDRHRWTGTPGAIAAGLCD